MNADAFKRLHPYEYLTKYLAGAVRPDGRGLAAGRAPVLLPHPVDVEAGACDASALVRLGGTTVIAGVTCSLDHMRVSYGSKVDALPVHDVDLRKQVRVAVQTSSVAALRFTQGPTAAAATAAGASSKAVFLESPASLSSMVADVVCRSGCLEPGSLLVELPAPPRSAADEAEELEALLATAEFNEKEVRAAIEAGLVSSAEEALGGDPAAAAEAAAARAARSRARYGLWSLDIDIVVVGYDGNLPDACVLAASAALGLTRLPAWTLEAAKDALKTARAGGDGPQWRPSARLPLKYLPIAATCMSVPSGGRRACLVDPTSFEEDTAWGNGGARTTVVCALPVQVAGGKLQAGAVGEDPMLLGLFMIASSGAVPLSPEERAAAHAACAARAAALGAAVAGFLTA